MLLFKLLLGCGFVVVAETHIALGNGIYILKLLVVSTMHAILTIRIAKISFVTVALGVVHVVDVGESSRACSDSLTSVLPCSSINSKVISQPIVHPRVTRLPIDHQILLRLNILLLILKVISA